jgi:hypothetical protein
MGNRSTGAISVEKIKGILIKNALYSSIIDYVMKRVTKSPEVRLLTCYKMIAGLC